MLKLMFFLNMFDMIYLNNDTETIGRRARSGGTRCARACVTIRQSFFRACAGFLFHLAHAPQPVRHLGHLLHSELVRRARLDRAPRERPCAWPMGRPLRAPSPLRAPPLAPLQARVQGLYPEYTCLGLARVILIQYSRARHDLSMIHMSPCVSTPVTERLTRDVTLVDFLGGAKTSLRVVFRVVHRVY